MAKSPRKTPPSPSSNEQSYLQRLQFNPAMLSGVVAKYVSNIRIVALLIITIILLGTVSFLSLPRRLNPEVKIPIVSVVTILPGASPEDVESLVTIPLENKLRGSKGLDTITSVSNENVSVITMQFLSSVSPDKAKDDSQSLVDTVTDLPSDAKDPTVQAFDFEDQPIWTFAVTTSGDPRTLMSFAKELQNSLEELSKVDRVETSGFEKQEVVITLRPEKIQQYGINPLLLAQSIQRSVKSYPAGNVDTATNSFSLTIAPSITTVDELRQIKVSFQNEVFSLGEVATVAEKTAANQQVAFLASADKAPQQAVTFYVYKNNTGSIDQAGKQVHDEVDRLIKQYDEKYAITTLSNTSEEISEQFTDLLGEFRSTIILVFVCLLIFLGLRQAIISSFTVPLTFLSAFIFMNIFGMSINFLSLFAFLLALGLLVDDTIVVVSAMTTYYKTGKFTPLQTGLLVWKDTIVPIWSTTITTIWSFLPLLLSTGIIGEFIKPIPIVVTVTMLSSTGIAVLITLPIMMIILKPVLPGRVTLLFKVFGVLASVGLLAFFLAGNPLLPLIGLLYLIILVVFSLTMESLKTRWQKFSRQNPVATTIVQRIQRISDHGLINLDGMSHWYYRTIYKVLSSAAARKRVIIGITLYAIAGFLLLPLGLVKNEFFPKTDTEALYVSLELPAGSTLQTTELEAKKLLSELVHTPETNYVVAEIGKSTNQGGFGGSSSQNNSASFTLHLPPKEERSHESYEIAEQVRAQYKNYNTGTFSVIEQSGGPPAGADIQIQLQGDELDQLNTYADELVTYLKTQPGMVNVNKSFKTGTTQLVFVPDQTKLAQAGIGIDQVGLWVRTYASGFTLDSVNFDKNSDEKQDIVFKMSEGISSPTSLSSVTLTSQTGNAYPLLSLGRLATQPNPTQITREDGNRTITVTAGTVPGFSTSKQNQELIKQAESLNLPDGYTWKTGGVNEENQKSVTSILQAMVISAVLILITMVIQFNSFRQAFIVLIVIPLAVSSVFFIFALTGTPLSFPALIGVLSLFGIVVTNSMFIVDKINLNLREGMKFKESIADAGASRLEPIILTKLCSVLGLLPITIADPLWRGLGGAIISGLLIASTIMLLFIPSLYYNIFQHSEKNTASA